MAARRSPPTGRATRAPRTPRGNALSRWRRRRRTFRETHLLAREARRLLRRYRGQISDEINAEVSAAIDAVVDAKAQGDLKKVREKAERLDGLLERHFSFGRKSVLREYAESIGVAIIIALLLRAFVVEAFKIPSGSMIPTLRIGDHIFVNKFVYGLGVPWTTTKLLQGQPSRGDVIVFVYPEDEDKVFIKRVVGLGGDTVAVRNNVVFVNGEPLPQRQLHGPCSYLDGDQDSGIEPYPRTCVAYEEQQGEHHYRVIYNEVGAPHDYPPHKVPEGHVFVMGDNRDNSSDSRTWGTVPLGHIKGKALIIWLSLGGPSGIRWQRFFDLVHSESTSEVVKP